MKLTNKEIGNYLIWVVIHQSNFEEISEIVFAAGCEYQEKQRQLWDS